MNDPVLFHGNLLEDDSAILNYVRSQVTKYAKLYYSLHEFDWIHMNNTRTHRCASLDFNYRTDKALTSEPDEQGKSRLPVVIFNKNPELAQITEVVFQNLLDQYRRSSWAKEEKVPLLHVVAVKQFYFDCCVSDSVLYRLLLDALQSKIWVNIDGFYKSVESAQRSSVHNIFSFKRYEKKSQKRILIQKLLFFFCFVQMEVGQLVTKDNLYRVFTLANRKESTRIRMLVDLYFKIADNFRGSHKDFVSFKEFRFAVFKSLDDD